MHKILAFYKRLKKIKSVEGEVIQVNNAEC